MKIKLRRKSLTMRICYKLDSDEIAVTLWLILYCYDKWLNNDLELKKPVVQFNLFKSDTSIYLKLQWFDVRTRNPFRTAITIVILARSLC